ncbi:hypothetical protein E3N88_08110 [Mikania micrantha]|uniref:Uncharacterized protein n=1 Tax=Mikania micrantha TaxID=192012 RepID=A0A5N6PIE1_9ASTR|nr:hypothetical protein E3N88_08110 [Mikania micrantha]
MDGLQDDSGDGSMQCTEHPFKNNTPSGGICAICLQEKLGKLVSSSFPITVFPSSSSSSPSFRSDINGSSSSTTITATVSSATVPPLFTNSSSVLASNTQISSNNTTTTNCHHHQHYPHRSRMLYLLSKNKKKKKDHTIIINQNKNLLLTRSNSTAGNIDYLNTPHKRGFWSFIHLQKHTHSSSSSTSKTVRDISSNNLCASRQREMIVVEENESPYHASFERKVSRSKSVGCGSRSFSGEFFERISTGFGDCTLRRVESQREGKSKVSGMCTGGQDCIKERVKCGGLFSGFMITSSSSSSSSSYWVAANPKETSGTSVTRKVTSSVAGTEHSRSKNWVWALASPMRAFSKPSSSKREFSNKNPTPNLAAIPSLLSVRS